MLGRTRDARMARLGTLLEDAAERVGDQQVIDTRASDVDPARPLEGTYASWAEFVRDLAGRLHEAGVRPWDRVAIFKGNNSDVVALACAAARLGAIPAPLAWTHPPDVLATMLSRLDRPVLIADRERLRAGELDAERLRALTSRTLLVEDEVDDLGDDVIALPSLKGASAPPVQVRADDDPMVIMHTSGTTGVPKLVVHSARTVATAARYETRRVPVLGLRREDTVAFADPFFHGRLTTGLVGAARSGPKLVLVADPDPTAVRDVLVKHAPTIVESAPNAFLSWEPLAADPAGPFRNVRLYFNTFDPIHTRTVRVLLNASGRRFPVWVQALGQSESGPVSMGLFTRRSVRPGRGRRVAEARGIPVSPLTRVRAVDPDTGRPVGRGNVGLLEVRRDPCLDYVGEHERYLAKRRDGWWNLGDLGIVNRSGTIRLIDREVDRIADASCIQVESTLLERLERATEVIVLAVRDGRPVPVVSTADDEPIDDAAWSAATAGMPPLADPVFIRWDEFPRTATWKVRRHVLREHLLPGTATAGAGRWT
ncbi:MAG TPA: class I adenylate-forming enzyme family protein [Thermoleophilaceae bacterium]|jgi:acyl-coenzyme A synthetase/AMP-(fatty) acid ligase